MLPSIPFDKVYKGEPRAILLTYVREGAKLIGYLERVLEQGEDTVVV